MNENEPASLQPVSSGANKSRRVHTSSRKGMGGTHTHGPLCKCYPCKARRGREEALALAAGAGRPELDSEPGHIAELKPRKGKKPPHLSKTLRDRVAEFIQYSMTYPNLSRVDLASKMGISKSYLAQIIKEGKEGGLLDFEDPLDRIEYELIPRVVDNLKYFLDAKDKTVTIEAAKGTVFRTYQEARGINDGNQTVLALKIEQADGSEVKVMTGHIVGKPKGLPSQEDEIIYETLPLP